MIDNDATQGEEPREPDTLSDWEQDVRAETEDRDTLVVDVEGFEGPLDLLLALARTQKVDLAKISVLALAQQYLDFIAEARRLRIEIAADYLVMAAWLAFLKSKLLLPAEPSEEGEPTGAELAALAGLFTYVDITQVGRAPLVRPPRKEAPGSLLLIDAATRANLELMRSNQGARFGSLLSAIDRTVTGAGARELASRLGSPLTDTFAINARLDAVSYLAGEPRLRQTLREELRHAPDLARALARLALARGGPRDLGAVRDGIAAARALAAHLSRAAGLGLPQELDSVAARLKGVPGEVEGILAAALADELPLNKRDGGFIRDRFDGDLDEHRRLRDGSRQALCGQRFEHGIVEPIRSTCWPPYSLPRKTLGPS